MLEAAVGVLGSRVSTGGSSSIKWILSIATVISTLLARMSMSTKSPCGSWSKMPVALTETLWSPISSSVVVISCAPMLVSALNRNLHQLDVGLSFMGIVMFTSASREYVCPVEAARV